MVKIIEPIMKVVRFMRDETKDVVVLRFFSMLCITVIIIMSMGNKTITKQITICKDGPTRISGRVEIKLEEVVTIKTLGWSNFKTYPNSAEVLEKIYIRICLPHAHQRAISDIENKNEDQWYEFVQSLSPDNIEVVLNTPFAYFDVYVDKVSLPYYQNRIYCKNVMILIPETAGLMTLRLSHVYDTRDFSSGEREAVTLDIL